jgi:hypothetical protein
MHDHVTHQAWRRAVSTRDRNRKGQPSLPEIAPLSRALALDDDELLASIGTARSNLSTETHESHRPKIKLWFTDCNNARDQRSISQQSQSQSQNQFTGWKFVAVGIF